MTDLQIGGAGIAVLILLLLMRVPVGIALGSVSLVGIYTLLGLKPMLGIITAVPYELVAHWTLSSVPMFLLMGYVCYHANLTEGLFRLARLWLSALPGGLAIASVWGAAGFSAVTGSSVACAAAMGRIAVPEMLKANYDKGLAAGSVAAAGTIGSLIPPSILLLIFGIFAEVPIGKLFIGGFLPGLLTALMFVLMIYVRVKITPTLAPSVHEEVTWRERFAAFYETWPVILLVIGVFGGLFGGIFTPTEAGAVGAALSIVIAFMKRDLNWPRLRDATSEAMQSTAAIFVIAIGANLLTRFLAFAGVSDFLAEMVLAEGISQLELILGISVVYLVLGMFLDPLGIMLLTLPIFLPAVESLDVNLIWFGILIVKYLEIGLITPPVGLNVFVIKGIVGDAIKTEVIFKGILWFVVADLITLALLIGFPEITLLLPELLY